MPLINTTPATPPVEKEASVVAYKKPYRGVTVDTQYTPETSLLTYIAGSPMLVNYYSQVLNRDSNVDGQNVTRAAQLQPYKLVQSFILKVTTPLTYQQIETNKAVGNTGQANVYPHTVIPNNGDMFLTDIGDGQEGIFRVTGTTRMSLHADTTYQIEYVFVAFSASEQGQAMLADLAQKTIETYTYVADFAQYGDNPILLSSDAELVVELRALYRDVLNDWISTFFFNEFKTLMLPGQDVSAYDPFMVGAVKKMFDASEHERFQYLKQLNVGGVQDFQTPTVWDVFLNRNPRLMYRINQQMCLSTTSMFARNPMLETIRWTGIRLLVYPLNPKQSYDDLLQFKIPGLEVMATKDVPSPPGDLEAMIPTSQLDGLPYSGRPVIKQVLCDRYYIFSEAFYKQTAPMQSRFEALVWDCIEQRPIDLGLLKLFAQMLPVWGGLEQFYYTPFLLVMIRQAVKSL